MGRQFEDSGGGGGGGGGTTTAQSARELVSGESKRTNFEFPLFLIFKPFISVSLSVYVWAIFAFIRNGGGERKSEHFPTPLSHTTIIIIFSFSHFSRKKKSMEGGSKERTYVQYLHTRKRGKIISCHVGKDSSLLLFSIFLLRKEEEIKGPSLPFPKKFSQHAMREKEGGKRRSKDFFLLSLFWLKRIFRSLLVGKPRR